jgi:uncharacterized protein YbaR (Trm112 family)
MLATLGRLILRITLIGFVLGLLTAVAGLGAIAVSEFLSRRKEDEFDDDFMEFDMAEAGGATQELDEEFLSLLACPVCKTSVRREGEQLVCETCGRRYPIRDGIPVMLVEEAEGPAGSQSGPAETVGGSSTRAPSSTAGGSSTSSSSSTTGTSSSSGTSGATGTGETK